MYTAMMPDLPYLTGPRLMIQYEGTHPDRLNNTALTTKISVRGSAKGGEVRLCVWVSDGELEGHIVTCPWHFTPFDVKTGEAQESGVTDDPIPVYEVRVEGDDIQIRKP